MLLPVWEALTEAAMPVARAYCVWIESKSSGFCLGLGSRCAEQGSLQDPLMLRFAPLLGADVWLLGRLNYRCLAGLGVPKMTVNFLR